MHRTIWKRQLVQWAFSTTLLLGLLALAWHSSLREGAGRDEPSDGIPATGRRDSSLMRRELMEQRQSAIEEMPTCLELQASLRRLDAARSALLRQAANGSTEASSRAVEEYHLAVETVRAGLERLRNRLTPEEYNWFWSGLELERDDSGDSESAFPESELGILQVQGAS